MRDPLNRTGDWETYVDLEGIVQYKHRPVALSVLSDTGWLVIHEPCLNDHLTYERASKPDHCTCGESWPCSKSGSQDTAR